VERSRDGTELWVWFYTRIGKRASRGPESVESSVCRLDRRIQERALTKSVTNSFSHGGGSIWKPIHNIRRAEGARLQGTTDATDSLNAFARGSKQVRGYSIRTNHDARVEPAVWRKNLLKRTKQFEFVSQNSRRRIENDLRWLLSAKNGRNSKARLAHFLRRFCETENAVSVDGCSPAYKKPGDGNMRALPKHARVNPPRSTLLTES